MNKGTVRQLGNRYFSPLDSAKGYRRLGANQHL